MNIREAKRLFVKLKRIFVYLSRLAVKKLSSVVNNVEEMDFVLLIFTSFTAAKLSRLLNKYPRS